MIFAVSFKVVSALLALGGIACLMTGHPLGCGISLAGLFAGVALNMVAMERSRSEVEPTPSDEPSCAAPHGSHRRRVLIVGAGSVGQQLADRIDADPRCELIGFVDDCVNLNAADRRPILGTRDLTAAIVQEYGVEELYLAHAPTWQQSLAERMAAECPQVAVSVVPSPFEAMMHTGTIQHCGDIALVRLHHAGGHARDGVKRLCDVIVATVILCLGAPFLLLTALLIRLTSAGPVIFAQDRIGRFGRPFKLYKFRTMVEGAESRTGPVLSSGLEDSRLTPIGRWLRLFRIDEFPQLWNVLRGEMSLVGPRPERPFFVEKFECMVPSYARRHQVRPGITGLAQVCGGYHTDARDKLRFDLIYISHQSLWMDVYVLLRTVLVVVMPDGR